jgi:hypothetical protein
MLWIDIGESMWWRGAWDSELVGRLVDGWRRWVEEVVM